MNPRDTRGVVFNIQHYSIHDGPGIRTTVFMKGCALRCQSCQNPESQSPRPELFFNVDRCRGCGECVAACPEQAIELVDGRSRTDRTRCRTSGECVKVCPNDARSLMGGDVSAGEVFDRVAADAIFYERSNGGMTLSGGEPLAQPDFAVSLLRLCRDAAIHTTVDTCGYAGWQTARRVFALAGLVLYDFKHMDPVAHRQWTGASNELILENARRLRHELSVPMRARVPVVPGFNDSVDNLRATARFVATELGESVVVHLLPYHRLGEAKCDRLGRTNPIAGIEPPDESRMFELQQLVQSFGVTALVGG